MNASVHFHTSGLELYDKHPVLIAASSRPAAMQAVGAVEAAGLPVVAIPMGDALARLDRQSKASAFWLEIDSDSGQELDRLLDRIEAEVAAGSFPAIVSAPRALIDPIAARIGHRDIELLADGTPADRALRWRNSRHCGSARRRLRSRRMALASPIIGRSPGARHRWPPFPCSKPGLRANGAIPDPGSN